jgi:hypothetical protein
MLNPWYVTGLIEGEGCFCITISKHKTKRLGFDPRLMFEIEMVIEDKPLLDQVAKKLGCGRIYILDYSRYGWRPHAKLAVKNIREIREKVVPFFKKYQLSGKKKSDFEIFCKALRLFENKEHLTLKGIQTLRKMQKTMNLRQKSKWSSARVRENRAPGGEEKTKEESFGYLRTPPIKPAKSAGPETSPLAGQGSGRR